MNAIHELARLRRETARLERDTEQIMLERDESMARIQKLNIEEGLKLNELLDAEMKNRDAKRTRRNLQHRIQELEAQEIRIISNAGASTSTSTPATRAEGTRSLLPPPSSASQLSEARTDTSTIVNDNEVEVKPEPRTLAFNRPDSPISLSSLSSLSSSDDEQERVAQIPKPLSGRWKVEVVVPRLPVAWKR